MAFALGRGDEYIISDRNSDPASVLATGNYDRLLEFIIDSISLISDSQADVNMKNRPSANARNVSGNSNDNHQVMKHLTILLAISGIAFCSFGQTTFKRNDIYLEAGGNGLFASFNYERQLTKQPGLGFRLGVGSYSEKAFYLTIPVGINYLFKLKNNKSFIDAGLGATWTRIDGNLFGNSKNSNGDHFVNFVPSIGYRRHTSKDLMWRISVTPIANTNGLVPWLGLSVGKRF